MPDTMISLLTRIATQLENQTALARIEQRRNYAISASLDSISGSMDQVSGCLSDLLAALAELPVLLKTPAPELREARDERRESEQQGIFSEALRMQNSNTIRDLGSKSKDPYPDNDPKFTTEQINRHAAEWMAEQEERAYQMEAFYEANKRIETGKSFVVRQKEQHAAEQSELLKHIASLKDAVRNDEWSDGHWPHDGKMNEWPTQDEDGV